MATFERMTHDVQRGAAIRVVVDGVPVAAFDGESVATTLLTADRVAFRHTPKHGAPRGVFCAMGVCFDCLVTIDGISQVRACMVTARDGMAIETVLAAARTTGAREDGDARGSL